MGMCFFKVGIRLDPLMSQLAELKRLYKYIYLLFAAMPLIHCMMCVFDVVGVIAVALTEKKVEQLNESTTFDVKTSFIVFYSFSDPSNPQVWKLSEKLLRM